MLAVLTVATFVLGLYNVGKEDEYSLKIRINFGNKGTPNEQVNSLYFYDKDGYQTDSISFDGFYVG